MFEDFSFADNTVGYLIMGSLDKTTINELKALVFGKLEQHSKINLYLEDSNIGRITFTAAAIATIFPLEYAKRFHKIALVTDRKWIHVLASIDNKLIDASLKHFNTNDRLNAIGWIASGTEEQPLKNL